VVLGTKAAPVIEGPRPRGGEQFGLISFLR